MQDFLFPNHFTGRLRLVNRDADIQPVEVDEIMDSLFVHPGEDDNEEHENLLSDSSVFYMDIYRLS